MSDEIEKKSKIYSRKSLKPLDALHLASAIREKVDYFCTSDDDFLKKAKRLELEHTVMVSPIELIRELENE